MLSSFKILEQLRHIRSRSIKGKIKCLKKNHKFIDSVRNKVGVDQFSRHTI